MTLQAWLSAATGLAFLALAFAAGTQRSRHPLAVHVGLMSAGLFGYELSEVVSTFDASPGWLVFGDIASSVTAIPTLELFIAFVGKTASLARVRWLIRAYFGGFALYSAIPVALPSRPLRESAAFAVPMLAGLLPGFALVSWLLARHERTSSGKERARTRLIGAAMVLGCGGIAVDLAAMAGADLPRVSHFGLLGSAILIAAATLQLRVVERPTVAAGASAGAIAFVAVAALAIVQSLTVDRRALFLLGTLLVLVVFIAALRPFFNTLSEERARARYLTTLGRFSSQMAHDLRNPLAAIKGAAQFLTAELSSGRPLEPHAEFIAMIIERADRMERLVADYQRMGRLELAPSSTEANPWLAELLRGQGFSDAPGGVRLVTRFEEALPRVALDRDLFGFAIENLVRNAREAMPSGGTLTVSTSATTSAREGRRVVVRVRDDGPGMDVRTRERALAGFFTTKPEGTGLGLAFVARVVEAHGGSLRVESEEGRGTEIALDLPASDA